MDGAALGVGVIGMRLERVRFAPAGSAVLPVSVDQVLGEGWSELVPRAEPPGLVPGWGPVWQAERVVPFAMVADFRSDVSDSALVRLVLPEVVLRYRDGHMAKLMFTSDWAEEMGRSR